MNQLLSRRSFFRKFILTSVGAFAGLYLYRLFKWRDPQEQIADIIQSELATLDISREDAISFARDFIESDGERFFTVMNISKSTPFITQRQKLAISQFKGHLVDTFLKSSSFWYHTDYTDEKIEKIRYIKLYDSFSHLCINPFAQI